MAIGAASAVSATGAGAYSVDPAGVVTMDSPLRAGDKVNARLSAEALIGSGTETTDNTFDMLVAIPAPTSAAALAGPYWVVTLEFPGGSVANARNTIFSMNSAGIGQLAAISRLWPRRERIERRSPHPAGHGCNLYYRQRWNRNAILRHSSGTDFAERQ